MDRRFTILFADDDLGAYRREIEGYFAGAEPQWDLRFATSLKQALAYLSAERVDGVVLDVELTPGGREGIQLLVHLRRYQANTPVIVLTDVSDARVVRDAFLSETLTEDFRRQEVDPDGFLFKEEILANGRYDILHWKLSRGLHHYGRVANPRGILVTHGTDTMAWGLCYLRYALKNLTANVAVTGSQVPLEGYYSLSDALGNLKTSLYLLTRLRPAHLFAVFNNGQSIFSGRLTKYRKWHTDAFDGRVAASAGPEGVHTLRKDWVIIPYEDQRLEELHLVRTGGTIESQRDSQAEGALKPTGDFVWKYLNDALSEFFATAVRHDLYALDSSNMSFEEWAGVAAEIERIGVASADTRFDLSVKPVYANPLFTTEDYRRQFSACGRGAIFAGYGGGNANTLERSARSVLPALREAVRAGTFVGITSQVPLEPYDADYDAGLSLLEAGGVPCGDLPMADAQVKLSYILGHPEELRTAAAESGLPENLLVTAGFLSGVSMRRALGMQTFIKLKESQGMPLRLLPDDPFVSKTFEEGLRTVVEACATCPR
jgi:L-asparaginase/Glu-tRNA(Gln) amidotransferase subunit D